MCLTCWEKHGSSKVVNAKVRKAVELIGDVYGFHGAGGGLHVVVDDWNIDDGFIVGCIETIRSKEYMRGETSFGLVEPPTADRRTAELKCAWHLLRMTIDERNSALWHEWTRTSPK